MHLIDAKCNNRIITSLFHFASTLATQNEIKKNQNVIIITLLQNVLQHSAPKILNRLNLLIRVEEATGIKWVNINNIKFQLCLRKYKSYMKG